MRIIHLVCLVTLLAWSHAATASSLQRHFLGDAPQCKRMGQPVLLVLDLTRKGEIDDSITAFMTAHAERMDCLRVLGVVSIFGNGGSSTAEIHANMEARLPGLGCGHWQLLRGPDESHTRVMSRKRETRADRSRLARIAAVINASPQPVTILEAGPMTVTARLLGNGLVARDRVRAIYGVGGRMRGEMFQTGRNMGRMFSFSDFNMRKDILAVDYIVRHHGRKLTMVTYQTGIGTRAVPAPVVAESVPMLAEHAFARRKTASRLGFHDARIPSWDTWPIRLQMKGGDAALNCKRRKVQVRPERLRSGRRSRLRLILDPPAGKGHVVNVCHR